MTIKWVKSDPLVMNGEPFCYGTRLTVRNLLEMRANGLAPAEMLAKHPELRRVGIAEAFLYASQHRERYAGLLRARRQPRGARASARRRRAGCRSTCATRRGHRRHPRRAACARAAPGR